MLIFVFGVFEVPGLAILAFLATAITGIVLGVRAKHQVDGSEGREVGRRLAKAAIVVGATEIVLVFVLFLLLLVAIMSSMGGGMSGGNLL
jgi:xanthine/uracil/vitamin C permease (AzgA family)